MAFSIDPQPLLDSIEKLSDAQKVSLSQIVWKEYLETKGIRDLHDIKTGVTCNTPIPLGDAGNDWTYMRDASNLESQCDDLNCNVSVTLSTKKWNPVPYACSPEFCYADLECKLRDFFNSEKCSQTDPTGTQYVKFLSDLIGEKLKNSLWVKAWFTTENSEYNYLSGHDGLFVQLLTLAPAGNNQRIEIPENALNTYAEQEALDPQRGFEVFNAMRKAQRLLLKNKRNTQILTTRALAENYLEWLRETKQVNCCERDPLTNIYTEDRLSIYGLPIKIVDEWDSIIDSLPQYNNGTKWDAPHRAVLTYKENIPLGTCDAGELDKFDVKHDTYSGQTKFVTKYTIDSKVLVDEDFVIAV